MCPSPNRPRAPRGTLTRERVVDAAMALIDSGGVDALSMPKLARQLGVGAMSLYGHIESKDDLLDAVVQRVLAQVRDAVRNVPSLSGGLLVRIEELTPDLDFRALGMRQALEHRFTQRAQRKIKNAGIAASFREASRAGFLFKVLR